MGLMISVWSLLVVAAVIDLVVRVRFRSGSGRKLKAGWVTSDPEGRFNVTAIKKGVPDYYQELP